LASLRAGRFQQADYFFTTFAVNAEANTPIEEILKPEWWANVAMNLKPMDEIIVRAEDGAYRLHLFVENCGRTWAKVRFVSEPLIMQTLDTPEVSVGDGEFLVKWFGPHDRYCVLRASDKEKISKGHQTRDAAELWAKEHVKTIAPRPKAA